MRSIARSMVMAPAPAGSLRNPKPLPIADPSGRAAAVATAAERMRRFTSRVREPSSTKRAAVVEAQQHRAATQVKALKAVTVHSPKPIIQRGERRQGRFVWVRRFVLQLAVITFSVVISFYIGRGHRQRSDCRCLISQPPLCGVKERFLRGGKIHLGEIRPSPIQRRRFPCRNPSEERPSLVCVSCVVFHIL